MTKIIDFESHLQSPEYVKRLTEFDGYPKYSLRNDGRYIWHLSEKIQEPRPMGKLTQPVEDRVKMLDGAGVDMQVLSSNNPACESFPAKLGIELAKIHNDHVASFFHKYPDRFMGLCSLPVQDVHESLIELDRCVGLGFKGLMLFSNVQGEYVERERFWPIYERCEKLRLPVFLHPTVPARIEPFSDYYLWGPVFGYGADAAIAALRILMSGLLEKYRRLRIVLGHLGETIPFLIQRIDWAYHKFPEEFTAIKRKPSDYFIESFYVDTSGVFNEPSLMCTYESLGHDRIVFGSDYPFEDIQKGIDYVKKSRIPVNDQNRIFADNLMALLNN